MNISEEIYYEFLHHVRVHVLTKSISRTVRMQNYASHYTIVSQQRKNLTTGCCSDLTTHDT